MSESYTWYAQLLLLARHQREVQVLLGQTMDSVYSITDSDVISHFDQRFWTLIATLCVLPTVHLGGYGHLTLLSALGITCLTAIIVLGISCSAVSLHPHTRLAE